MDSDSLWNAAKITGDRDHRHHDRCFFCLHPVENPHPPNSNSRSTLNKQLRFLFRHLNLTVTSGTKRPTDFEVHFCPGCKDLMSDFFNWYQQLELDRMFINSIIGQINDVINNAAGGASSNNNYHDKTDLFGRMRSNLIDKCTQHLKKATPRVTLARVDDKDGESLGTTIKVDEELINPTETENSNEDAANKVLSDDEIGDDQSGIDPVSDPSQYRKPPGIIASSEPWQAPGDIFKDHVTTKYYRSPRGGFQRRYIYTCKLCNAQVYDKPAHRSFHRNERPYECPHCDLGKFTEPTRLRYHLLINHPEQNFLQFKERTLSPEKFKIAVKMLFEGLKFIQDKDKRSRLCPHCDQRFGTRGGIIGHMIEKHHSELVLRLDSLQENTELLERREKSLNKIASTANRKIHGVRKPSNSKMDTTKQSEPQPQKPEAAEDTSSENCLQNQNPLLEVVPQAQDNQYQMSLLISSILGPEEKTDPSTEKLTLHFESREENSGQGQVTRGKGQGQPASIKRKLSDESEYLKDDDKKEKSWDHFLRRPRKQEFRVLRDEPDIGKNLTFAAGKPSSSSSSSSELMQCPYCSENGFWQKADLQGHLVNAHLEQFFIFAKKSTITLDRFKVIVNLLFANIKIHIKYVPNPRGRVSKKKKVGEFHCDHCDSQTSIFRETFKTRSELKGHMIQNHLEQLLERLNELQEKENVVAVDVAKIEPEPEIVQIDDDHDEEPQPEMVQAPPLWRRICEKTGIPKEDDFMVRWKLLKYIQNKQGLKQPIYLYFCKLCNKAVRNLSLHRRVHYNDKRYKCGYCVNARFIQSSCLAKHITSKHLEKIFETAKFPPDRSDAEFELMLDQLFCKLSSTKRECESRGRSNYANYQYQDQHQGASRSRKISSKFVCVFCDQAISCSQGDLKYHLAFKHYNDVAQRLMKLQQPKQQQHQEERIMTLTTSTLTFPQVDLDLDLDLQQEPEQKLLSDWKAVPMNFEDNPDEVGESEIVKIESVNEETERDPLSI